jgi:hypothetical protein
VDLVSLGAGDGDLVGQVDLKILFPVGEDDLLGVTVVQLGQGDRCVDLRVGVTAGEQRRQSNRDRSPG